MFRKKPKNQPRNSSDQSSKRVYSYYSNTRLRTDEQTERARIPNMAARLPKPRHWLKHTPSILAFFAILVCLGFILTINTDPKIVQLEQNNGVFLQTNTSYQTSAREIINDSLLNRNKITLNTAGISQQLKQQFPELDNVSVTVPLINRRPVIYLTASQPALILQSESAPVLIDNRGIAILPAHQAKNLSKLDLPVVTDQSNIEIKYGKPVLTSDSVKFITDVSSQFKAQSIEVDKLTLPTSAPNELNIQLSGQKYFIKMDTTRGSREQVGAYLAAIKKISSLKSSVNSYLDVRVPGRVFYK